MIKISPLIKRNISKRQVMGEGFRRQSSFEIYLSTLCRNLWFFFTSLCQSITGTIITSDPYIGSCSHERWESKKLPSDFYRERKKTTCVSLISIDLRSIMSLKERENDFWIMLMLKYFCDPGKPFRIKNVNYRKETLCGKPLFWHFVLWEYETLPFKIHQVFEDFFWYSSYFVLWGMFIRYIWSPSCLYKICGGVQISKCYLSTGSPIDMWNGAFMSFFSRHLP